ncbi:putative transcription factor interactor and regulator Znf-B family [Helianthus anomalus]
MTKLSTIVPTSDLHQPWFPLVLDGWSNSKPISQSQHLLGSPTKPHHRIATANGQVRGHTKHERVLMCEVCEQAPTNVTCKADVTAMCAMCDQDIHSANPLTCHHVRIPVVAFYNSSEFVNLTDTVFEVTNRKKTIIIVKFREIGRILMLNRL